jgi:hypothetical protein
MAMALEAKATYRDAIFLQLGTPLLCPLHVVGQVVRGNGDAHLELQEPQNSSLHVTEIHRLVIIVDLEEVEE